MKVDDLFRFKRVADPQVSPDGKPVAYVVTTVDLDANKDLVAIWLAPTGKGRAAQLTNVPGKKDRHPRWSPDGKTDPLRVEPLRDEPALGHRPRRRRGEAADHTSAPAPKTASGRPTASRSPSSRPSIPEFSEKPFKESDAANKKKQEEIEKNPVKAKVFTKLFYRHWDRYVEDKRQHLFVMPFPRQRRRAEGRDARRPRRLPDLGHVLRWATISPSARTASICSSRPARPRTRRGAPTTTSAACPSTGGKLGEPDQGQPAADSAPRFSPDGKTAGLSRPEAAAVTRPTAGRSTLVECDAGGAWKGKPRSITDEVRRLLPMLRSGRPTARRSTSPPTPKARQPIFAASAVTAVR